MTSTPPATTLSDLPDAPRLSRPERVAEAIKAWVVAENLAPGDRLPGEQELIERFGMSKGTIREAMRLLEAQGLVKTRPGPGGGSFVHEVSEARARALLGNYFYFKNLTIADIYQLRVALEPELAASLAGRLTEAQLAALEANIARYEAPPTSADEDRAQHVASLDFHRMLAGWAQNALLGFLIGFMASMLSDLTVHRRLYEPRNYDLWRRGRDYQIRLVRALREGDPQAARAIMDEHMRAARDLMEVQEARMARRFLSDR
jgi:DNA-binding FadR family transcriptional regulator